MGKDCRKKQVFFIVDFEIMLYNEADGHYVVRFVNIKINF